MISTKRNWGCAAPSERFPSASESNRQQRKPWGRPFGSWEPTLIGLYDGSVTLQSHLPATPVCLSPQAIRPSPLLLDFENTHNLEMPRWSFLNPPSEVEADDDRVTIRTQRFTDYWHPPDRIAANGHFYYTAAILPFFYGLHLQCTLSGDFKTTYDQACIMIRASPEQWIKAGVEYIEGVPHLRSRSIRTSHHSFY